MTAVIVSWRRRMPPYGMVGGAPGKVGRNYVERADGTVDELAGTDMVEMKPGDTFVIETPGGGYGEASSRQDARPPDANVRALAWRRAWWSRRVGIRTRWECRERFAK